MVIRLSCHFVSRGIVPVVLYSCIAQIDNFGAQWCNPLTLQKSGGQSSIPRQGRPLEHQDKGFAD